MRGRPGLQACDKDTGGILLGAQIIAQDGKIKVLMVDVDITDRVTIIYCHRVADTDPDSPALGEIGWRCMGIRSVEEVRNIAPPQITAPELPESLATLERHFATTAMTVAQDAAMKEDRKIMGVGKRDE